MNQITVIHCHESPSFTGPWTAVGAPRAEGHVAGAADKRRLPSETKPRQKRGVTVPFLAHLIDAGNPPLASLMDANQPVQTCRKRGEEVVVVGGWLTCLVGDAKTENTQISGSCHPP